MDDNTKKGPVKENLSCSVCERQFDRKSRLVAHYKTHTGERPFNCPYCSKSFASKGNCNTHVRVHTRERPYVCQYCDKKFSQHGQMVIHVRRHTGEKPYVCSHCKKGFACSKVLKIHVRTHTGEKPYVCDFCSKGFAAYANLVVHRRIHTRERPYACKLCGRSFEHSGNLVRHERGHHVDGGIRCIPCGRLFQESKDLGVHMNNSHPNDVSKEDLEDQGIDVSATGEAKSAFSGQAYENIWQSQNCSTQASSKDLSNDINNNSNSSNNYNDKNNNSDVITAPHKVKEEFRQESPDSGCAVASDEDEVCKDLKINRYFLEAGNTLYRRELVQRQLSLLPCSLTKTDQGGTKEIISKNPVGNPDMVGVLSPFSEDRLITSAPQVAPLNMSILKSVDKRAKSAPSNNNSNDFSYNSSNTLSCDEFLNEVPRPKSADTLTNCLKNEAVSTECCVSKTDIHFDESKLSCGKLSKRNLQEFSLSSSSNNTPIASSSSFTEPLSAKSSVQISLQSVNCPITPPPYTIRATEASAVPFAPNCAKSLTSSTFSSLSTGTILSSASSSGHTISSLLTPYDLSLAKNDSANKGTGTISFSAAAKEIKDVGASSIVSGSPICPSSFAQPCKLLTTPSYRDPLQGPLQTLPSGIRSPSEINSKSHGPFHIENGSMPINLSLHSNSIENASHSMCDTMRTNETEKNSSEREMGLGHKRKCSDDLFKQDDPVKCIKTASSPTEFAASSGHKSVHERPALLSSNVKQKSSVAPNVSSYETNYSSLNHCKRTYSQNGILTHNGNASSSHNSLSSSLPPAHSQQTKDIHLMKSLLTLVPSSASVLRKDSESSEDLYPFGKGTRLSSHIHPVKIRNIRESIRMSVSHICPTQVDKKSFKSNVEMALIALLGKSTVAHLAYPNKTAEQVLVILLDLVGMTPCADVRVDEDERLRVNMRQLLEYGFPEPSAWRSLGWHQETIETITEKIAMWSLTKQWRQSRDLASWASSQVDPKLKLQHGDSKAQPHLAPRVEDAL